jgi:6-phosphogluconolactonase (cycloisomerase 2 family)
MTLSIRGKKLRMRLASIVCLALVTGTLGCGGGSSSSGGGGYTPPPPPPHLVGVAVTPNSASIALGLTQQFSAAGTYSDGTTKDVTSTATWTSAATDVASVSAAGLVSSLAQGQSNITATLSGVSGSASITVGPAQMVAISITPAQAAIYVGSAPQQFSATATYTDKSTTDISGTVTWVVSNSHVAQIDSHGLATVVRNGYSTVSASTQGMTATAVLAGLSYPRYATYTSLGDRSVARSSIDASTGQLRMIGYQLTGANYASAFDCATTDPDGQYLYVSHTVNSTQPGDPPGQVEIYQIDGVSGSLTELAGSPFPLTVSLGCIQFEPNGRFGYAVDPVSNGSGQLVTFSRDPATGLLTQIGSINLGGAASNVAMDPLGQYLYVSTIYIGNGPAEAFGYAIDATTGSLTPVPNTPFLLSPISNAFTFHPSGNIIYMSNSGGATVDTYSVDRSTGKLSILSAGTVQTCINPSRLAFTPDASHAYLTCSMDTAHDSKSASLTSYSVSSSGLLTQIGSAATDDIPEPPVVDPSGQFLYVSAYYAYIDAFQIGPDGIAKASRRFGARNQLRSLVVLGGTAPVNYSTLNAYVTTTADNQLSNYPVHADGSWGSVAESFVTQLGPFSLSVPTDGADLVLTSGAPLPNLQHYFVDAATGALGQAYFPLTTGTVSGGAVVDPAGLCAFQTDPQAGMVYHYLKQNGQLSFQWGVPAQPGAGPLALDPTSSFLYVANQSNSISVYQYWGYSSQLIEMNGHWISPYPSGSPYQLTATPQALVADPTGLFLYVVSKDQTLVSYAVDYYSGAHLSALSSLNLGVDPLAIAVEPTGHFVYVAYGGGISAAAVDPKSGALTALPLNPPVTIANTNGISVDPSRKYLYATTASSNGGAVYGFSIGADGNLTPLATNQVAAPSQPSSLAFRTVVR